MAEQPAAHGSAMVLPALGLLMLHKCLLLSGARLQYTVHEDRCLCQAQKQEIHVYPPPPCKLPPLAISPPPHPGDRHFHVFLVNMYCAALCCPSAFCMALHCFPITTNQAPVCVL